MKSQGTLRDDVELFAAGQKANDFKKTTVSRHRTVDGDHGRIETRNFTTIKHMALSLLRGAPGKDSLRPRRKVAARDDDVPASPIAA